MLGQVKGFILLEVLAAMLILQIGLLGTAELFLNSIAACYNAEHSLQALELLRGEMEKIEKESFEKITTSAVLLEKYLFVQYVANLDENEDNITDCKKIQGRIIWKDFRNKERTFTLVTYRW